MEEIMDFIKSKKKVLIICMAVIVLTVIIGIGVKQAKERSEYERSFHLLFVCELNSEEFNVLEFDKGFKKDLLTRIKTTNDPEEIVECVNNLNEHGYKWSDEDGLVKNAITSQIKIITQNLSIEEELKFYVDLDDSTYVHSKTPEYGNVKDVISQSELENKIKESLPKTDISDWSCEKYDNNHAIIGGTPGDLDITLITLTNLHAYYGGEFVSMPHADSTEEEEFCYALRRLKSYKDMRGGVYYNPSSSTPVAVVFSHGEMAYEQTTIFTSYGDIRFSLGD